MMAASVRCAMFVALTTSAAGDLATCGLLKLTIWFGENALWLKPRFSEKIYEYSAMVDYQAGPLWIDPVPVGPQCQARRSDSIETIQPGSTAKFVVTVNSDWPKDYTITVTRRSGTDTTLSWLRARSARLVPTFQPDIFFYSVQPQRQTPLVLVGVPTDSGERWQVVSISPQGSRKNMTVEYKNNQVPGLLPKRGQRRVTLGRVLQKAAARWVLQLPSSMVAGGLREIALPAHIVINVHPAIYGKTHPSTYQLTVLAPTHPLAKGPSSSNNAPGSALRVFTAAMKVIQDAAMKAAPEKVAAMRAAKAKAAKLAAEKQAQAKLKAAQAAQSTTKNIALASTAAPAAIAQTSITSTRSTTSTTSMSTTMSTTASSVSNENHERTARVHRGTTALHVDSFWVIVGMLLSALALPFFRIGGDPLYAYCYRYCYRFAQETEQASEVDSPELQSSGDVTATPSPPNEELPEPIDDVQLMRALVHGAT